MKANSGTYSNQWMIVDNKLFTPGQQPGPNTLWIASQRPGLVLTQDVTPVLLRQGYWPSFNIPYFTQLWNEMGYASLVKQYGSEGAYLWKYLGSFRQVIFARDAPKVESIEDMQSLMQENNWQTDPLSRGSAELAIAARMDLSPGPLGSMDANGAIDCKLTSAAWMRADAESGSSGLRVLAKCGPTVETQKPFQWSKSPFNNKPHLGQPDLFDFDWQTFEVQQRPEAK